MSKKVNEKQPEQIEDLRNFLITGDVIRLRKLSASGKPTDIFTEFSITGETGRGGSSICYEALSNDEKSGRLKEFYPVDFFDEPNNCLAIDRNVTNQLFCPEQMAAAKETFISKREEFKKAYCDLAKARSTKEGMVLNNFIPDFEIYEGINDEDQSSATVYIWTPNDKKVKSFSKYLEEMRKDIDEFKTPERHLAAILTSIITLSECIKALHALDLIHMDIKPDNFGVFLDSTGDINPTSISLYDVNTLYSINSSFIKTAGTKGFTAPEILTIAESRARYSVSKHSNSLDTRSDIYSIGATLFYSIMADSDALYSDSLYNELDKLVANSNLISSTDITSNSALHDALVRILKKSLAYKPDDRYSCCTELIADLEAARVLLFPADVKDTLGEKFNFDILKKHLDSDNTSTASSAIQNLLYTHPLYEKDNGEIKVLVLGSGTYAHKFMDTAFEVAQVPGLSLSVTSVSNNTENDKARYLNSRPEFSNFFTVDGVAPKNTSLGNLNFVSVADISKDGFVENSSSTNENIIASLLLNDNSLKYSYVFIALGSDALNKAMADLCCQACECPVFYAFSGTKIPANKAEEKEAPIPVQMNFSFAKSNTKIYRELTRMAFNCHMVWDNSLNININKLKASFRIGYNFNSSFANILSIKYKLHSVGIEHDMVEDPFSAAKAFREICKDDDKVAELTKSEHNRWMVNLICQGWKQLDEAQYSTLKNATKDKKNKLHPCLVDGDGICTLQSEKWTKNNFAKWDSATNAELKTLDPLDRMSVMLHRVFAKKATESMNLTNIAADINKISQSIASYDKAAKAFEKLTFSINEVIEGKTSQTRLFADALQNFKNEIKYKADDDSKNEIITVPEDVSKEVSKNLKIIEDFFFPILESRKFTDFKKHDLNLIKEIPFILTYSSSINLYVPFGMEGKGETSNRTLFANVASSLVLNPSVITYIVDAEDIFGNKERFKKSVKYALSCIQKRNMQADVNMVFLQPKDLRAFNSKKIVDDKLKTAITEMSAKVKSLEIIEYESDSDLREQLHEYLKLHNKKNDKYRRFTAIERNKTGVSGLLRGLGCFDLMPYFEYDSFRNKFKTSPDCEFFSYVFTNDFLRISDMFSFKNAESSFSLPEMQLDYEFFWNLYKSSSKDGKEMKEKVWKKLCEILKRASEKADFLRAIPVPQKNEITKNGDEKITPREEHTYFVPAFCRQTVKHILNSLSELSETFFIKEPLFIYYNSSTYKLTVETTKEVHSELVAMLSDPYTLHDPSKIKLRKDRDKVLVSFDRLTVSDIPQSDFDKAFNDNPEKPHKALNPRLRELLAELEKGKYIINLQPKDGNAPISFTYSSPQIKQLLTNEGRILELYVYYKCIEQNCFDQIANSCEIIWNDNNVSNEFDIILTSKYRALFVECKARHDLNQDFYYKLAQLNQLFGINATPVLVADLMELSWQDNSVNKMQRSRGEELGVKTIYEYNDIVETETEKNGKTVKSGGIGEKLRKIMENPGSV